MEGYADLLPELLGVHDDIIGLPRGSPGASTLCKVRGSSIDRASYVWTPIRIGF